MHRYRICAAVLLMAVASLRAQQRVSAAPFKVVLVGDSTVATEGGWGPGFCAALVPNVACVDLAANGRSTKSFIDEGRWARAIAEHGRFYFIQFGHNDQKPNPAVHADADGLYSENLRRYIRDVRAINAVPVLVTPLSRRNYMPDGTLVVDGLEQYAAAVKSVATEQNIAVIDLLRLSHTLLAGMTQQQADAFDMQGHEDAKAENSSAAKPDRTHLNDKGKAVFGRMVADEAAAQVPDLRPSIVAGAH